MYSPEGLQPMDKPHQGMDIPEALWPWVTRFAIKCSKLKGPTQEIHFLGLSWPYGQRHITAEQIAQVSALDAHLQLTRMPS